MRAAVHLLAELAAISRADAAMVLAGPLVLALVTASAASSAESRGLPFWKALVEDCVVPEGESAFAPRQRGRGAPRLAVERVA